MHKLSSQATPFAAEIRYFTIDKSRALLKELLYNYNLYHFEADKDWTHNEKNEHSQQAETAKQTFRFLFCNKDEFSSPGAAAAALDKSYHSPKPSELLDTMTGWCEDHFSEYDEEEGAGYSFCEADTVAELHSLLDPLIFPSYSIDEPSLWPLVDNVCVGVPTSRVLKYVTLVDLPGITDTNRLRVNATHDTIRKCQALWYVAAVDRICTDPDLDSTISNYAERFRGTLAVVVTKIDHGVSDALARDMRDVKGQSIGDYEEYSATLRSLKPEYDSIRNKLKRKRLSPQQKNTLNDERERLEGEIRVLESKKFECVVDARNSHITDRLRREKAMYLPEGTTLPVYCVSNLQYAVHKGVADAQGPALDIEATGIPKLREYTLSLAAPGLWEAHKQYIRHKVRVLFEGVRGWAHNCSMDRHEGLADVVKTVNNLWEAIVDDIVERTIEDFSRTIIKPLRQELGASQESIMRYYEVISVNWKAVTFKAFFQKGGKHYTRAVGAHSWNESFLEPQLNDVLDPAWEEMASPKEFLNSAVDKMTRAIEDLPDQLDRLPGSVPLPMGAFERMLTGHNEGIKAAHRTIKSKYEEELANIKLGATLDQHTGYFTQSMQPCYEEGKDDKGAGVCARLKLLLLTHLNNTNPLERSIGLLEEALKKAASSQAYALRIEVKKIIEDVSQQCEVILRREQETPEETDAREKIAEFLNSVMPEIHGIEEDFEAIEGKQPKALLR